MSCSSTGGIPPVSLAFIKGDVSLDGNSLSVDGNVTLEYALRAEKSYNEQKVICIAKNNATRILNATVTCEINLNITCKFTKG